MANSEIKIKTITKSSIKLDTIATLDRTNDGEFTKEEVFDVDGKQAGYTRPFISINGIRVDPGLTFFELDTNGFLPVCSFTFTIQDGLFLSAGYPKDGDIVSLYIRAAGDVYKPIRMDFNILSIDGNPEADNGGNNQTFTILSECRIPGIYTDQYKAFRNKTSAETLLEVSQDLGLGFSTNDLGLTDNMTWICPGFSYYDFIIDVANHSFKDDFSYYDVWVDIFYNLNFVNLGNQFGANNIKAELIKSVISGKVGGIDNDGFMPGFELPIVEIPLIFSNLDTHSALSTYIQGYTLLSDSGQNTNETGYQTTIQYYDKNNKENNGYGTYEISPITASEIGQNTFIQKGRATEDLYKMENRHIWAGGNLRGTSATTHINYNHAKIQNKINILDSMKFNLVIDFPRSLPFIHRGQVVPVNIYVKEPGIRKANTGEGENKNDGQSILDNFLSGLYVISGYEISYNRNNGEIIQRLNLRKKTWTLNSSGTFPKHYPVDVEIDKDYNKR